MSQDSEKIINDLLKQYRGKYISEKGMLTTTTIVVTTLQLMKLVESYRHMTGVQKKQIVIKALEALVSEIADEEDSNESQEKIALEQFLKLFIPSVIDNLITVDNGKLKIKPRCSSLFKCCC